MVFEAIKRMASKGGAGLEAERGAEEEYNCVDDCTAQLREILREMQEKDHDRQLQRIAEEQYEARQAGKITEIKDWQKAERPPERLDF